MVQEVIQVAYRIVYTGYTPKRSAVRQGGNRVRIMTAVFFLCFLMLAKILYPQEVDTLRDALLPPEQASARQAFSRMITDLREGETVEDAIAGFCRYVIENSETQY